MAPRYRRRFKRAAKKKYSVHQSAGALTTQPVTGNGAIDVVNFSPTEGMRKVKNLSISMASSFSGTTTSAQDDLFWALVYVPEGTAVNPINITSPGSMYEPNQYVMACGIFDFSSGPTRVFTPLSRNLNNGDRIVLVVRDAEPTTTTTGRTYNYVVRYAITLQ